MPTDYPVTKRDTRTLWMLNAARSFWDNKYADVSVSSDLDDFTVKGIQDYDLILKNHPTPAFVLVIEVGSADHPFEYPCILTGYWSDEPEPFTELMHLHVFLPDDPPASYTVPARHIQITNPR